MAYQHSILVINGPNLNRLGSRETNIYGKTTLEDLKRDCIAAANNLGMDCQFMQANDEGTIIEAIHQAIDNKIDAVLINAGAYTHTSVAIRDALLMLEVPLLEIHLSNIFQREEFRHHSFISDIATGIIAGFGPTSYHIGITAAHQLIKGDIND